MLSFINSYAEEKERKLNYLMDVSSTLLGRVLAWRGLYVWRRRRRKTKKEKAKETTRDEISRRVMSSNQPYYRGWAISVSCLHLKLGGYSLKISTRAFCCFLSLSPRTKCSLLSTYKMNLIRFKVR